MSDLAALAWPMERLSEAMESLARRAGMKPVRPGASALQSFPGTPENEAFERWLDHAGATFGIEVEPVLASGAEMQELLRAAGPAMLRYREVDESKSAEAAILLLLSANAHWAQLLGPDGRLVKFPLEAVRACLCADAERPVIADVDALLNQTHISARQRPRIRRLLIQERMAGQRIAGCWLLRTPPSASFTKQLSQARVPSRLVMMMAVFAALFVMEIAGWTLIGRGALGGRFDTGWLLAWALLLLGTIPLRWVGGWLQGTLAIALGVLLKQRLLTGALQISMHEARRRGAGQWLSRVIESEALESLAMSGGFSVLIAMIELCLAAWILSLGAGGG